MLRKCSNHGFKDISQLNIFHNGLRYDTKMLLDAAAGGTMMVVDVEQATNIIDTLTSTYYQDQNDRQIEPKKGKMYHNTSNEPLAHNKILTQQMEALMKQISKLSQQLQVVESYQSQIQSMKCDFCGGDHQNGHCSFQNNPSEEKIHYMGNQGRQDGFSNNKIILKIGEAIKIKALGETKCWSI